MLQVGDQNIHGLNEGLTSLNRLTGLARHEHVEHFLTKARFRIAILLVDFCLLPVPHGPVEELLIVVDLNISHHLVKQQIQVRILQLLLIFDHRVVGPHNLHVGVADLIMALLAVTCLELWRRRFY